MNTYSKYRRAPHRNKYWIHALVIFSLYCIVSEIDYREATGRVAEHSARYSK